MGFYIEGPALGKADYIAQEYNGEVLPFSPDSYEEIPAGKALIVVVHNGPFDAAAFAHNKSEFMEFTDTSHDARARTYVLMDRKEAEKASGYAKKTAARSV